MNKPNLYICNACTKNPCILFSDSIAPYSCAYDHMKCKWEKVEYVGSISILSPIINKDVPIIG